MYQYIYVELQILYKDNIIIRLEVSEIQEQIVMDNLVCVCNFTSLQSVYGCLSVYGHNV